MVDPSSGVGAKAKWFRVWYDGKVEVNDLGVQKASGSFGADVIEVAEPDRELVVFAGKIDGFAGVPGVLEVPLRREVLCVSDGDEDEHGGISFALAIVDTDVRGEDADLVGRELGEEAGAIGECE